MSTPRQATIDEAEALAKQGLFEAARDLLRSLDELGLRGEELLVLCQKALRSRERTRAPPSSTSSIPLTARLSGEVGRIAPTLLAEETWVAGPIGPRTSPADGVDGLWFLGVGPGAPVCHVWLLQDAREQDAGATVVAGERDLLLAFAAAASKSPVAWVWNLDWMEDLVSGMLERIGGTAPPLPFLGDLRRLCHIAAPLMPPPESPQAARDFLAGRPGEAGDVALPLVECAATARGALRARPDGVRTILDRVLTGRPGFSTGISPPRGPWHFSPLLERLKELPAPRLEWPSMPGATRPATCTVERAGRLGCSFVPKNCV